MGPTLASTLPCVMTMPLGSPVVPEVKRISSGVLDRGRRSAPISVAGSSSSQSSKARVGIGRRFALHRRQLCQQQRVAHRQFGIDVGGHASGKFGGAVGVERNGQHAAQQAAVKGGNPLRAVLSPDQDAVALDDASRGQKRSETAGERAPARHMW